MQKNSLAICVCLNELLHLSVHHPDRELHYHQLRNFPPSLKNTSNNHAPTLSKFDYHFCLLKAWMSLLV